MSNNLVTIDLLDEASLLEACDILHDSRFDLSALVIMKIRVFWSPQYDDAQTYDVLKFSEKPKDKLVDIKLLEKTGRMYTTGVNENTENANK